MTRRCHAGRRNLPARRCGGPTSPETGRLIREVRTLIGEAERDGPPDGQLLARFVEQRDERAFELLVRRYSRLVLGACRRGLADPATV